MIKKMHLITRLLFFSLLFISFASCNESEVSSKEEVEIRTMDSSSKSVEDAKNNLEEQTKKVEESLEKLDKEFDSTN